MEIRVAPDASAAAVDAAEWIAGKLRLALRRRGKAALAVSGGSTPAAMFASLVAFQLPWDDVNVWQVDERIGPDGSPDRNAPLLAVFDEVGAHVRLMPVGESDLTSAAHRYADGLPASFDVVHLGLGDDGHTASWLPADPVVDDVERVSLSGLYHGTHRMTLTPRVVNGARHRLVLATGVSKAPAMRGWLLRNAALPIDRLHRGGTVVVLDASAASELPLASPRHASS